MDIHEIPDFAAFQQITEALWSDRASVMVGAGFSRNADRASPLTPEPPLWNQLASEMGHLLNPDAPKDIPTDAPRVAEEYRALFGPAALNDFVREHIRDEWWAPGKLHIEFLELPWADVLTTNYDTLLERAALEVNARNYEVVRIQTDLAHARAPRIVKLHGSLGTTDHFIIAEEDYRRYPTTHAAFVNFARQSFIENEFCLVGFSGDDANFLQWSGWVRDHLTTSARRIYLVGVLDLSPARRRYLEARNVAPIDFGPLVDKGLGAERHQHATQLFLDFLKSRKPRQPHDWRIQPDKHRLATQADIERRGKDVAFTADLFRGAVQEWRKDRMSFPGWLVPPAPRRRELIFTTHDAPPLPSEKAFAELSLPERGRFAYEVCWRRDVSFSPIDPALAELLAPYGNPEMHCELERSEHIYIAFTLLRTARENGDDAAFEKWATLVEGHVARNTDASAELGYQRALRARDRLEFNELADLASKISGQDPYWAVRKAGLLCEAGEFAKAAALSTEAVADLRRRQRQDRKSLWIMSRRAWAESFAPTTLEEWAIREEQDRTFSLFECDPWEIIRSAREAIRTAIDKHRQDNVGITPQFEAGHFKDSANTIHFTGSNTTPTYELARLIDVTGMPLRTARFNFLGDAAQDAMELVHEPSLADWLFLVRATLSHSDAAVERHFGRISVAKMPPSLRTELGRKIELAIGYWRQKLANEPKFRSFYVERLRSLIEILARLTICESAEIAKTRFDLAADLARDRTLNHWWLFAPIGKLAAYSIEASPPIIRPDFVLPSLEWPTPTERNLQFDRDWPSSYRWFADVAIARPAGDARWSTRIAQLIEIAKQRNGDRLEAVLRLSRLEDGKALLPEERKAFGDALWSWSDGHQFALPSVDTISASVFFWLPAPDEIDVQGLLRKRLFNPPYVVQYVNETLPSVIQLIRATDRPTLLPTPDEAGQLFDALVALRAKTSGDVIRDAFEQSYRKQHLALIAETLGALASVLSADDKSHERLTKLIQFIEDTSGTQALSGLPNFVQTCSGRASEIAELIQRQLVGPTFNEVNSGVQATLTWQELVGNPEPGLFKALVETIVSLFEGRRWIGLQGIVSCLVAMVGRGVLTPSQIKRLDAPLGYLISETRYEQIELGSERAVSVSLVRAECVRLSASLSAAGRPGDNAARWLETADADPLPEVRYARRQPDHAAP